MNRRAYIFLDEAGNFDFSPKGTRYFVLTSVSTRRPFAAHGPLDDYKHDCLEFGLDTEYFHCAEDNPRVRGRVFELIAGHLDGLRIDSLIVEKPKTGPALREDRRFYPEMLGHLLKFVLPKEIESGAKEVIVITDTIPVQKKRQAIEKAIQQSLATMLPAGMKYRILHNASRSHYGLQVADYCCWAVFRKWQKGETEHYDRLKPAVRSEFDIFRTGTRYYNDTGQPDPLVQLALIHLEFEALHPFKDGNGRLGRMLIPLFLYQRRLLSSPNFYMSAYLEANRETYQERLRAVSPDGAWSAWVAFFLEGVIEQASDNDIKARAILSLYERVKKQVVDLTHSQHAIRAVDFIFRQPIFAAPHFVAAADIPKPTAMRILNQLREGGLLATLRQGRGRRFGVYAFGELLNLAEGRSVV